MQLIEQLPLETWQFWLAAGILFVGAWMNGAFGFGLGMLAAPLLVLVDPVFVPGPVLLLGLFVTLGGALTDRVPGIWPEVSWALAGRTIGSVLGAFVVALASPALLGLLIGISVVLGVLLGAMNRLPKRSPRTLLSAGFGSGMMGTIAAIGGPPIVLLYQSEPLKRRRAILSLFFFVGTFFSLLALILADALSRAQLVITGLLLPIVAAAFGLGMFGPRFGDDRAARVLILAICLFAGLAVILRNAMALLAD